MSSVVADGQQMPYSQRDTMLKEWTRKGYFLPSSETVVESGVTSIQDTLVQKFTSRRGKEPFPVLLGELPGFVQQVR